MKLITKLILSLICLCLMQPTQAASQAQLPIIPYPQSVVTAKGAYNAKQGFNIRVTDSKLAPAAQFLQSKLKESGREASLSYGKRGIKGVNFVLDSKLAAGGAYSLVVARKTITIKAADDEGAFYGVQSLLQLINNHHLACVSIDDAPRYAWRGYMLDEARHFSGEKRVKEMLDLMAYYKMNRFHWHLTDAQGWRIEIKQYPRLSEVGGIGTHSDPDTPAQYYTQEQIKDIIKYAADRHIEIIPEIDMPGHATAANHAYPEFNGGGSGQFPDFTFNPGKEGTYQYLTNILAEVAALFPSQYLHIGGDEVAYGSEAWEKDPDVLALMQREGLKNVKEVERYFMHRMIGVVGQLGKTLIGWDELLDLDVDHKTMIMWWRHDKTNYLVKALQTGYPTVLCPRKPLYFDFVQHDSHKVGRIWDGFCPIEDVYAFPDPWFESIGVTPEMQSHIRGLQANAWSELLHTKQRVDFMTFPRICAVAESGWTLPEHKDYVGFSARLNDAYALFDSLGIYYFDYRDATAHPEPEGPVIKKATRKQEMDYRD
jgi:hexosaminidase